MRPRCRIHPCSEQRDAQTRDLRPSCRQRLPPAPEPARCDDCDDRVSGKLGGGRSVEASDRNASRRRGSREFRLRIPRERSAARRGRGRGRDLTDDRPGRRGLRSGGHPRSRVWSLRAREREDRHRSHRHDHQDRGHLRQVGCHRRAHRRHRRVRRRVRAVLQQPGWDPRAQARARALRLEDPQRGRCHEAGVRGRPARCTVRVWTNCRRACSRHCRIRARSMRSVRGS